MRSWAVSLVAALALTAAACAAPSEVSGDAVVAERNAAFAEAFASGDGTAVAAMYTTDAVVMPDGAPPVEGRDAIGQFWQSFIDAGATRVELNSDEVLTGANEIAERGRFSVFNASGASLGEGKYVVVWAREEDEWRLRWDIWNADAPPAPPAPQN
jgi:ketosteroid isomerase-like protein